jgi:2-phospho-L-lactate transferase/gluconeogenesis factor (CofD/UPF0052 family)/CTP:molybdopterin cytidylyltransferase MocA
MNPENLHRNDRELQRKLDTLSRLSVERARWTCIIPAAGKGSRLGYHLPKTLFPITGESILKMIIQRFSPYCGKFVVVASPDGKDAISQELASLGSSIQWEVVVQPEPKGMGDAIDLTRSAVGTDFAAIVWGDQVCLNEATIRSTLLWHQSQRRSVLTIPTAWMKDPYIHLERNEKGRLVAVRQKREGEIQTEYGENDIGFFAFTTAALFDTLARCRGDRKFWGKNTHEFNLLQTFPEFESHPGAVSLLRIAEPEETIGLNAPEDVPRIEGIVSKRKDQPKNKRLRVALFSGGRGTASIAEALLQHPQIELHALVNAYDDGLSTGRIRRYLRVLGPSDIRKNLARLIPDDSPANVALKTILEYRLPEPFPDAVARPLLRSLTREKSTALPGTFWDCLDEIPSFQSRYLQRALNLFLDEVDAQSAQGNPFDFGDCAIGNMVLGGAFLGCERDFNAAILEMEKTFRPRGRVWNVTQGEPYVLVGLKSDGSYLPDEAHLVSAQNAQAVSEIFLLPNYLSPQEETEIHKLGLEGKRAALQTRSVIPKINPEVRKILTSADLIIYGPGTQHSSLFPSYLTDGLAEAIAENTNAEKLFVANSRKDHEIQAETINSLTDKLHFYLTRKGTAPGTSTPEKLVTHYFFHQDRSVNAEETLAFIPGEFKFPFKQLLVEDWESKKGVHAGDRILSEIISLVNDRAQTKLHAFSYMVSIVVPVLNEAKTLEHVLTQLHLLNLQELGLGKEIIVVDGGSTDGSLEIARSKTFARVVEEKRGRGAALRAGATAAKGDILVFFPSDDEYEASDLVSVVTLIAKRNSEVVFGSRSIKCLDLNERILSIYRGRKIPYLVSKFGGMALSVLGLVLYNRFVSDPLTGIKAFDRRLFQHMGLTSNGVDLETELIARLSKERQFILEVPVEFKPRLKVEGKKITLRDGLRALWRLVSIRFNPQTGSKENP